MLFIFSTPELIKNLWQLKKAVFLHWCLICGIPFATTSVAKIEKFCVINTWHLTECIRGTDRRRRSANHLQWRLKPERIRSKDDKRISGLILFPDCDPTPDPCRSHLPWPPPGPNVIKLFLSVICGFSY